MNATYVDEAAQKTNNDGSIDEQLVPAEGERVHSKICRLCQQDLVQRERTVARFGIYRGRDVSPASRSTLENPRKPTECSGSRYCRLLPPLFRRRQSLREGGESLSQAEVKGVRLYRTYLERRGLLLPPVCLECGLVFGCDSSLSLLAKEDLAATAP